MSKRVQDIKPRRPKAALAWLQENIAEQQQRYKAIVKEMDTLAPVRAKWYQEFLHTIQTRGFNVTGDMRRKVTKAELPRQPKRKDRVVF